MGVQVLPSSPSLKQYKLDGIVPQAIGPRECAIYWAAWSKVAQARPDLDRHAITRRVLGENIAHKKLTKSQWAKLLSAFRAIAREARTSKA